METTMKTKTFQITKTQANSKNLRKTLDAIFAQVGSPKVGAWTRNMDGSVFEFVHLYTGVFARVVVR